MKVCVLKVFNSLQTEFAAMAQLAVEGRSWGMDWYDDNDDDNKYNNDNDDNNNSFRYILKSTNNKQQKQKAEKVKKT